MPIDQRPDIKTSERQKSVTKCLCDLFVTRTMTKPAWYFEAKYVWHFATEPVTRFAKSKSKVQQRVDVYDDGET